MKKIYVFIILLVIGIVVSIPIIPVQITCNELMYYGKVSVISSYYNVVYFVTTLIGMNVECTVPDMYGCNLQNCEIKMR